MTQKNYAALVLAGSRAQADDPLLASAGVSHKCFIDLEQKPMLLRVVESLTKSDRIDHVIVSINQEVIPEARALLEGADWSGKIDFVPAGTTFGDSFEKVVDSHPDAFPLVVTTGDNGLHTPDMIYHFCDVIDRKPVDVAVAMTRAEVILARYPNGQRAFHNLKDGAYSSCNLYALLTKNAVSGVRVFNTGGQFGKKPWRMIKSFGIMSFILYKLQRLSLRMLMARVSKTLNLKVTAVLMPYADAPIDVDNPKDLELVRRILQARDGEKDDLHVRAG